MTKNKSSQYNTIQELLDALKKAPQDKEVAFRVSTWVMILNEIQTLKEQLELNQKTIVNSKNAIIDQVKQELQSEVNTEDAGPLLF